MTTQYHVSHSHRGAVRFLDILTTDHATAKITVMDLILEFGGKPLSTVKVELTKGLHHDTWVCTNEYGTQFVVYLDRIELPAV